MEAEKQQRSLVKKLCEVMASVGWIEKTGFNEFHKYKYAQEADLVDALRGELAKRHVFIFPNVKTVARVPHEVETLKWDDKAKAKVPTVRKTQLTEIEVEWTFVDGETGEERTVIVHGVGEDNVDKGFYKAFTGSEKYMLMKSFLIPTGDDPERDSKEDVHEARENGREAAQSVAQRKIAELKAKQNPKPDCLFYVFPESHNGHVAEFINLAAYGASLDQIAQEGLRKVFAKYSTKITKDNTALVASEKLDALLEVLNGDCGIAVKKLEAAAH